MDKKYLIPIAIGVGVLVLILGAIALFSSGNEELGAGAGAAAAAALEAERRRQARAKASAELEAVAHEAVESNERLEELKDSTDDALAKNEEKVKDTSLADLVDEENKRRS